MIVGQIRLSQSAKDKMARLKGKTGIRNWNVLARWALCYSLREGTVPAKMDLALDGGVEMSWHTFAGEYGDVYELLVRRWCEDAGVGTDDGTVGEYLHLHIERGVGYLSGTNFVKTVDDLLALVTPEA